MTLTRSFVVNSLCCPSRAAVLTGTYSHTNGMYLNGGQGRGGLPGLPRRFHARGVAAWDRVPHGPHRQVPQQLLAGVVRAAGVDRLARRSWGRTPPSTSTTSRSTARSSITGPSPAITRPTCTRAWPTRSSASTAADQPLFMYFSPPAPHGPTTPAPRHVEALVGSRPVYPSFNERDVVDKPAWLADMPRLTAEEVDALGPRVEAAGPVAAGRGRRRRSDRRCARRHGAATEHPAGLHQRQRSLRGRAPSPLQAERLRGVDPRAMVVRWDGHVPSGTTSANLVANIDLAPTFAAAAGATTPGRSRAGPSSPC